MTNVLEAFWISVLSLGVNFHHFMKNSSKKDHSVTNFLVFEKQLLLQLPTT
jgi:hypothetical protein